MDMRPGRSVLVFRLIAPLCVAALVLAGCSSPSGALASRSAAASTPPPSVPATQATTALESAMPAPATVVAPSSTAAAVTVTNDVRFASAAPDVARWSEPLLDVYAPAAGAQGLPLVVMFPPHSITKEDAGAFTQLATAVAEGGAVAVVANWTQLDDPPAVFADPAALEKIFGLGQSVAGCAVSYAVAHAADYGADPSRLVLLGELYGGNIASKVALGQPEAFPGCASTAAWKATGLVAWDTDWLATMPAWDTLGQDAARAVAALSPWPTLADAPKIPVELVVSDAARAASGRCDDRDAAWMVARDPTGAMRDRLDEVGAYADGCQDLGDAAKATAAEMQDHGIPAELVALTDGTTTADGGGHVRSLGTADLATLAQTVLKAAGAAPAR
jgi:hypothetical protein